MEAKLINLEDYIHSGEGANGESFNHRTDTSIMLKLNFPFVARENAENEVTMAQKVYDCGIATPKPGQLVTDGNGRYGLLIQRIAGKKSFSRAVADDPEKVEEYARIFAGMCRDLHATHLPAGLFPDIKEVNLKMLQENPYFSAEEKRRIERFILDVPDADTAIHGDLQYSNAIMAGSGRYFIDLGDFACGNPLFDLGMVLICCKYSDPQFILETFHLDMKTAGEFWHWFAKGYWGDDTDPDAMEKELRPFAGLKTLLIERNSNTYFENFHAILNDTILR